MAKRPEQIGKYPVLAEIAQGGMGSVFTARHPTLDRTVIIKKLSLRGKAEIRERFRREAQIMMDLRNDAIVDVYDHFREGTSYYIVLEYVEGLSLDELIKQRRYLPNAVALLIFREVCQGLAYAHERKVIHRDIKPGNVLLSTAGEAKLADFGIATIHGESDGDLTREGMTLGTPSYMAPEQFQNTRNVDHRADIYSMGVMLYEMVTGKRPYPGSFSPDVLRRIQKGKYRRPCSVNPRVWRFTQRLIRRMLRPKPKRRVQHLRRLIRIIDRRLRVRSRDAARQAVADYVNGNELATVDRRRGGGRFLVALAAAALFAAAAIGVLRGYHRELFAPREVGALVAEVRVERGAKAPDQLFLAGRIAPDDGETPATSSTSLVHFNHIPGPEDDPFYLFQSDRMQLPVGAYRIVVESEDALWWESFELPSIVDVRGERMALPGSLQSAHVVRVDVLEPRPVPITVGWTVRDRVTRQELDGRLQVSVEIEGARVPWEPSVARRLRSGQTYTFIFDYPGYVTQTFEVVVKTFQSELLFDVSMTSVR